MFRNLISVCSFKTIAVNLSNWHAIRELIFFWINLCEQLHFKSDCDFLKKLSKLGLLDERPLSIIPELVVM